MATYTVNALASPGTLQEILLKEQVSDVMSNLFPLDMPLHQVVEQVPMRSTEMSFPLDTFGSDRISRVSSRFGSNGATAATTNAKPESHTFTDITPQYPAKVKGVVEIQGEGFSVSGTDRAVDQYAIADRYAYEALKATQATGNQYEFSFWWSPGTPSVGADLDSGGGTYWARQTQGLVHWVFKSGLHRSIKGLAASANHIDGNGNNFGTSNPTLNANMAWAYNANGATLDQAMFKNDLMNQWYNISGVQAGAIGFTGSQGKQMISSFALTANGSINDRVIDAGAKRLIDTIDIYETDFGSFGVSLCRYLNISGQSVAITQGDDGAGGSTGSVTVPYDEVMIFIKPAYYKIGVLRPVAMSTKGKVGDFEAGFVAGEMGLFCRNPMAGAGICNFVP